MEKCLISSFHLENLNKDPNKYTYDFPWQHVVIDNFITDDQFRIAQREILSQSHLFRVESDDPHKVQFTLLRYLPLARLFYSIEFKNLLSKLFCSDIEINENILVQIRRADSKTPAFPRHNDYTGEKRSIVVIYYLSPDWKSEYGGSLRLHKTKLSRERGTKCIEPVGNRLVAFFSDNDKWHSIEKVKLWERYSILSEWFCNN